jgi:hypothetical protein
VDSINFVCLGQTEFVKELGKKGQSSDITTYDSKKDDLLNPDSKGIRIVGSGKISV